MDKQFVAMEKHVCFVCLEEFETGSTLVHKRLRNINNPTTGWGICPKHQQKLDEGFVFLIAATHKGDPQRPGYMKQEEAQRTGEVAAIKQELFHQIFNSPAPPPQGVAFAEPEVLQLLRKMQEASNNATEGEHNGHA